VTAQRIVFYSWQSDLPNGTNRTFIESALKKAAKTIRDDATLEVEPVVDRDVEGVAGSPDISRAIFEKIERAQVFVCDVSIINQGTQGRLTPNPNVLVELGYALKALGEHRIILVQNRAYGGPELLPFDLRPRRTISYDVPSEMTDRSAQRKLLEGDLTKALRDVLSTQGKESSIIVPPSASLYIKHTVPMLDSPNRVERMEAVKALEQSRDSLAKDILLEALHHPARDVRINAALALISNEQVWSQLVPSLLEAQQGQDDEYGKALVALGKIASRTLPGLLDALRDGETSVRRNALRALGTLKELDTGIAPDLVPLLHDSDVEIRWFAVDILGQIKAVDTVPEVNSLLADSDSNVRRSAVIALGAIGSEDSIPRLLDALLDSDINVQSVAASALKQYGERAVPQLILALDRDNITLRCKVIEVLGQLKCNEAVPQLMNALNDPDAGVRRNAIGALGQMKVPDLTEKLVNALADPDAGVRGAAAYSLRTSGSVDAVPALIKALNDTFIVVRMHAAQSLGYLKDERAVSSLRAALRDEDEEVRGWATWALGEIGSSSAIDALKEAIHDKEGIVSRTAIEILRRIGTEESLEVLRMHQTS